LNEPPYQLVATEITCIECRRLWSVPSERWRVYLTEDEPREPVAYCAECAEREFE
jgi:hypothetical protein